MINNRYKIIDRIGKGRSQVFRCSDKYYPNHDFAIKILPAYAAKDEIETFKNEFRMLKNITHPNIISVFDFGKTLAVNNESKKYNVATNSYFFTMEYFEGDDLSKLKDDSEKIVTQIVEQISLVLFYLHTSNLVYTDLKLDNILFRIDKDKIALKFIDFGFITYLKNKRQIDTRGTLDYLAPELISQEAVDHKIDLYSFGVILYFLVYKSFPYSGATELEMLNAHLKDTIEFPSTEINQHIISIIKRLLNRNLEERFSNALEVLNELNSDLSSITDSLRLTPRIINRASVSDQISDYLAGRSNGNVLLFKGETGIGKSALLGKIQYENENAILIKPNGSNSTQEIFTGIFSKLLYSPGIFNSLESNIQQYAIQSLDSKNVVTIELARSLANVFAKSCKFILLIDSFESASVLEREIITEIVRILQSRNIHIILTENYDSNIAIELINNIFTIELTQFSKEETKTFINSSLSEYYPLHDIQPWVENFSDGNPANIIDLIVTLKDSGILQHQPDSCSIGPITDSSHKLVQQALTGRHASIIKQLDTFDLQVVRVVSIFSEIVGIKTLAELLSADQNQLDGSINKLRQMGIFASLSSSIDPWITSQSLKIFIKEGIENLKEFCLEIAEKLETFAGESMQSELAILFEQGGNHKKSFNYYEILVKQSEDISAFKSKAEYLNDILRLDIPKGLSEACKYEYAEVMYKLGEFTQSLSELMKINRVVFDQSDTDKLKYLEARCLLKKGDLAGSKNIMSSLINEQNFTDKNPDIFSDMANIELDLNNYSEVNNLVDSVLNSATVKDDVKSKMNNLKGLVKFYESNDLKSTLEHFKNALKLAERSNNMLQIVTMHVNIANIFDMLGNKKNAVKHWKHALKLNQATGNLEQEAQLLLNLGIFDFNQANYDAAIIKYEDALSIFRGIDYKLGRGLCLINLGEVHLEILEFVKANECLKGASDIFEELKNNEELVEVYFLQAKLCHVINSKTNLNLLKTKAKLVLKDYRNEKVDSLFLFISFLNNNVDDGMTDDLETCYQLMTYFLVTGQTNTFLNLLEIYINTEVERGRAEHLKKILLDTKYSEVFERNNITKAWRQYFEGIISVKGRKEVSGDEGNHYLSALEQIENESVTRITFIILVRLIEYFNNRGNLQKSKKYLLYLTSIYNLILNELTNSMEISDFNDDYLIRRYKHVLNQYPKN